MIKPTIKKTAGKIVKIKVKTGIPSTGKNATGIIPKKQSKSYTMAQY